MNNSNSLCPKCGKSVYTYLDDSKMLGDITENDSTIGYMLDNGYVVLAHKGCVK